MLQYDPSKIVQTQLNGLANSLSSVEEYNNTPVFPYGANDLINSLPIYRLREYPFLKQANLLAESFEYDLFIIAIPVNEVDANVAWKDTYRTQFSVPEGSYILGILGCAN